MPPGADNTHELIGDDKRERFLLDIWRGMLRLSKLKYQTRGGKVFVLVRLDIDGSPHTNPDGHRVDGTHIHIYRERHEDKWAYPIDPAKFPNSSDIHQTFGDFCRYCNVRSVPPFQEGLI
ncbi:MAG: hypothetical protein HY747_09975 [Elusimicrobia bacterium]|nr:hypothetical protein [Elusimicrobiota bacterium]